MNTAIEEFEENVENEPRPNSFWLRQWTNWIGLSYIAGLVHGWLWRTDFYLDVIGSLISFRLPIFAVLQEAVFLFLMRYEIRALPGYGLGQILDEVVSGLMMGIAQALLLRKFVTNAQYWVLASTFGKLFFGMASILGSILLIVSYRQSNTNLQSSSGFGIGINPLGWLLAGSIQALYLSAWVRRAGWWVTVVLLAETAAVFAFVNYPAPGLRWLVAAVITGGGMMLLLANEEYRLWEEGLKETG